MSEKKITGLTTEQAEESRRIFGENVLTPPKRVSLWKTAMPVAPIGIISPSSTGMVTFLPVTGAVASSS